MPFFTQNTDLPSGLKHIAAIDVWTRALGKSTAIVQQSTADDRLVGVDIPMSPTLVPSWLMTTDLPS